MRTFAAVAALALSPVAAGCGDDNQAGSTDTSTQESPVNTQTPSGSAQPNTTPAPNSRPLTTGGG